MNDRKQDDLTNRDDTSPIKERQRIGNQGGEASKDGRNESDSANIDDMDNMTDADFDGSDMI